MDGQRFVPSTGRSTDVGTRSGAMGYDPPKKGFGYNSLEISTITGKKAKQVSLYVLKL